MCVIREIDHHHHHHPRDNTGREGIKLSATIAAASAVVVDAVGPPAARGTAALWRHRNPFQSQVMKATD